MDEKVTYVLSGALGLGDAMDDIQAAIDQAYGGGGGSGSDAASAIQAGVSMASTYPWGTYSAATKALQTALNTTLKSFKKPPVGVDGKLGGETCGALKWAGQQGALSAGIPATCKSFTAYPPASGGGGGGVYVTPSPATTTPIQPYVAEGMSSGTKTALVVGGITALAVIGFMVFKK